MTELTTTFALIFAFACLGFAFYSRSRLAQSRAVFADVSSRLEALSKQNKQLEHGLRNAQDNADKYRQQSAQSDKQVEDLKQKLSDRTVEWTKLKSEREDGQRRFLLQREHLDEQVQVLSQQLSEAIREKKMVQDENARLQKEGDEKSRQAMEILRQQVREANQQTQQVRREKQQMESQLARAKEEAPRVKPEELLRYKQKVVRLEQLYGSMRGLRELAEERNKNWETALRYFAGHILQKPLDAELQTQSIGRLVGEALEKIGASLVIETRAEAAAAEAAAVAAAADHGPAPVRTVEAINQGPFAAPVRTAEAINQGPFAAPVHTAEAINQGPFAAPVHTAETATQDPSAAPAHTAEATDQSPMATPVRRAETASQP